MFNIKPGPQHLLGRKAYIDDAWKDRLADIGITSECDWMSLEIGTRVSNSKRVKAFRVDLKDGSCVYFKTYSFHGQLTDYFMRPSKCAVEVNSYQTLTEIGIPTINPIAFGEDRVCGMLKTCFIVTEGIPDTKELEKFAYEDWKDMPGNQKHKAFNEIFKETAKFTRMAHEAGFFHYDLKWRNIIVTKKEGSYKTIWIDCPRGRKTNLRTERGRMVDLSCLARLALFYLTKTQRLRFLYEYFGESATKDEVRKMWRLVSEHLERRPPKPVKFKDRNT